MAEWVKVRYGSVDVPVDRRICWPEPDATCIEGGCGACNDFEFRELSSIWAYVLRKKMLNSRDERGAVSAIGAFRYGENHAWGNADYRRRTSYEARI